MDFIKKTRQNVTQLYNISYWEYRYSSYKKVAKTGKPMIISTEMVTVAELGASVRAAKENGCKELILLKCKYLSSSSNKFKY